ncbi:S8 family peptidase [Deinococcus cellulosilyticus]|uniref:Uncharacterized protein n=1 Tax=Deinococcus cellulosilyticus (strain DSM 18568 / NBRC 106333 / KACC 11606 / 5516J-15) TaxID=1223518 RepID=A0A511N8Y7_DEIC1|nr:S8 family peptidase [Deinococcus cellulosilyticus]GEM49294.1 hypothetical protein DC3_49290 [Deinococcus cellulosilyticus NBRC 106333 = KACC 11606]
MSRNLKVSLAALTLTALMAACSQQNPTSQVTEQVLPQAQSTQNYVPDEVLVQYSGTTDTQEQAIEKNRGLSRKETVSSKNGKHLKLLKINNGKDVKAVIQELKSQPGVMFAEPNWIYTHEATSNDPYFTGNNLWGMYGDGSTPGNAFGSQAAEAWAAGHTGSKSVFIGVIDEGIQVTHPDLAANIWTNPFDPVDGVDNDGNGYVDDTHGWDFANGDRTVYDGTKRAGTDDHGTHVAGTIGGIGGNGQGVAGVSWNVTMISGKFLGGRGGTTANAIKAVDYFTDLKKRHGLNIVATSNSWGGGGFSQGLLDAINRAGDAGILFIAAAGNGGNDQVGDNNDTVTNYPSNYECTNGGSRGWDCVIAVAAINSTGGLGGFSNYGARTVDIGAPGVAINSSVPTNSYASYSGTSMATPHVSGAAALYASTHAGATARQIKDAILSSAVPTPSLAGKTVTGGRLNVSGF